jgi:hypothetical protein
LSSWPAYELALIQELVDAGKYLVTRTALLDARTAGCDECDIRRCVLRLTPDDFYKSMLARKRPGTMQDVYHADFDGRTLYVKLQVVATASAQSAVVISFKDL